MPYNYSEKELIKLFHKIFPADHNILHLGIGDDMAQLRNNYDLIASDAAVENIHFDLSYMSLADALYRTMTANLSDVAAMGAEPGPFTLSIAIPEKITQQQIKEAFIALKQCCIDHNALNSTLIGGDTTASKKHLFFSITILAASINNKIASRNTAKPNHDIIVIGKTGLAAAGLELLQNNTSSPPKQLIEAFKRPKAKIHIAQKLLQQNLISSMMDISDGLYDDLSKLLEASHCSAKIHLDNLFIDNLLSEASLLLKKNSLETSLQWALYGGEDYALLLTCDPKDFDDIQQIAYDLNETCSKIGTCSSPSIPTTFLLENKAFQPNPLTFYHFNPNDKN